MPTATAPTTETTFVLMTFEHDLADYRLRDETVPHYMSLSGFMHRWEHCSGMRRSTRIPSFAVRALWRDGVANKVIREIGWCSCACEKRA